MLFFPWRSEEIEVNTDPMTTYILHKDAIEKKHIEFNAFVNHQKDIHKILDYDDESPEEEMEQIDNENKGVGTTDQNIFDDRDIPIRDRFPLPCVMPQPEYEGLINYLNKKQRNYVLHMLPPVKSNKQLF